MDLQSYILSKKYTEESLKGAGALKGKSAYEIACENGFEGTESEWLASIVPQIGPTGTWIIGGVDTGMPASADLSKYATIEYVKELVNGLELPEGSSNIEAITDEEILEICKYNSIITPDGSVSSSMIPMTKDEILDICQ